VSASRGYDLEAPWPGVLSHHRDRCPARLGRPCTCGPIGYRGSVEDPQTQLRVLGPVMATVPAARAWKREQQVATEAVQAATNGREGVPPPIENRSYAAERSTVPWSVGDPLVSGDADELQSPPPAGRVVTVAQGVVSHVDSAAPARDTALAPAPVFRGMPYEAIWMILTIVTLVFAVIALMLLAESV
jgi:hypothetical protein